jgi:HPt (histidine-containing phosphotransfer) domain-containing protein
MDGGNLNRSLLDPDMTLERLAGDETQLNEIARAFTREAPQLVASINTALARNDMKSAFAHARSLKGAVASFEAPRVLNSVLNFERCVLNEDAVGAAHALPVAQASIEQLVGELAKFVGGSSFQA